MKSNKSYSGVPDKSVILVAMTQPGKIQASRWPMEGVRYGIGLAVVFAYLWLSNRYPLALAGDQKAYLSTALEMRETGSWLIPRLMGEPSYLKPPFLYWCLLVSWKLFGLNWFASVLPSLLAALGSAVALDSIVMKIDPQRYAKFRWSGMVMLSMLGSLFFSQTTQMESFLVFFQLAAWAFAVHGLSRPFDERVFWPSALAFAVAGVGALVKSPLYSVFWVIGYGTYLVFLKEWKELKSARFWTSLVLGIGLGLAWFVAVYFRDYDHFWGQYVVYETIEKRYGNGGSVFKLWGAWLGWVVPWVLPIALGVIGLFKKGFYPSRADFSPLAAFGFATSVPAALFFTWYPYRVDTYLHFLLPGSTLLALLGVSHRWGHGSLRLTLGLVFFPLAIGLGYLLSPRGLELVEASAWSFWLALGVISAFSAVWNLLWSDRDPATSIAVPHFIVLSLLFLGAFRMSAVHLAEQDFAGLLAVDFSNGVSVYEPTKNIWSERGIFSVVLGKPVSRCTSMGELDQRLRSGASVIVDDAQASVSMELQKALEGTGLKLNRTIWNRWLKGSDLRHAVSTHASPEQLRRKFEILSLVRSASSEKP